MSKFIYLFLVFITHTPTHIYVNKDRNIYETYTYMYNIYRYRHIYNIYNISLKLINSIQVHET